MVNTADMYKLIFNEARDGLWIINPIKNTIIAVNKSLIKLSGYSEQELLAMKPHEISADPPGTKKILMSSLAEGGEIFMERRVKRKDGTIVPVEISARTFQMGDQKVIISIFRDIYKRKQAEMERSALIEKLESALAEVKKLSGLLPICSTCKKIRDENGAWNHLEQYIQKHSEAQFTHGVCPECLEKLYGDDEWYAELKEKGDLPD